MAAVAPLAVDLPASNPDSSVTSLAASMGAGSYAYVARGCEGDVLSKKQYYYRDAGFAVEHKFPGPVAVGLRSTVVREFPGFPENTIVWNPYVSAEWRKFGLGAGYVPRGETLVSGSGTDVPPASAHLRAGAFDRMYFSIHLWEDVPAISGGGGSGTYEVKELVTWQFATPQPLLIGGFPVTDNTGDTTKRANGVAVLRIEFSDGQSGVLTVGCHGPGAPVGIFEGIATTKGFTTYYNVPAPPPGVNTGRTLFHVG